MRRVVECDKYVCTDLLSCIPARWRYDKVTSKDGVTLQRIAECSRRLVKGITCQETGITYPMDL